MRHKRGSKTCLSLVETSCDRMRLILNSSIVLWIITILTILYSEILTSEVIAGEDEISPSNRTVEWLGGNPRSPRTAHAAMHSAAERIAAWNFRNASARVGRRWKNCGTAPLKKFRRPVTRQRTCDKAAPAPAVMLHLRSRYVSKAAILTVPAQPCRPKIEVPLEFQGLGSLGAASWRRFFPCEFDSNKERARGCRRSVRFGSVRSLRNGLVRTGAR